MSMRTDSLKPTLDLSVSGTVSSSPRVCRSPNDGSANMPKSARTVSCVSNGAYRLAFVLSDSVVSTATEHLTSRTISAS